MSNTESKRISKVRIVSYPLFAYVMAALGIGLIFSQMLQPVSGTLGPIIEPTGENMSEADNMTAGEAVNMTGTDNTTEVAEPAGFPCIADVCK